MQQSKDAAKLYDFFQNHAVINANELANLYMILEKLSVINRDNGSKFTQTDRLDAIVSLLWDSKYRRINSDGLFHLYSARPLESLPKSVFVVSSHVDCEDGITRCFTKVKDKHFIKGTYDNAITNAAILYAMKSGVLPDDILVCFTGDEECSSAGAHEAGTFMRMHKLDVRGIAVLDVTDMGWNKEADFTVENNLWNDSLGQKVISIAKKTGYKWMFVPEEMTNIPKYVDAEYVCHKKAEPDESWEYDEMKFPCFSFCLPVKGEMHENSGVEARITSFYNYTKTLVTMLQNLQEVQT